VKWIGALQMVWVMAGEQNPCNFILLVTKGHNLYILTSKEQRVFLGQNCLKTTPFESRVVGAK
jgi:hypothetical protein